MTKQVINLGSSANSNNGDPLRTAFNKVNTNFSELYTLVGAGDAGNISAIVGPLFNHTDHTNVTVTVNPITDQIELNATLSTIIKDVNGSVFADDSTLLVDGVNGNIPSANLQGTEVNNWNTAYGWGDHSQAGYLTNPLQININGDDSATTVIGNNGTIQFKGDANITSTTDQSGTITYKLNSQVVADLTGSVFADDSTILINGTNGTIQADHLVGTLPAIDGSNLTAIITSFPNITSKPTTIAGYGITDAQATLVSATNIKTINGTSLLGSGDITIAGGSGIALTDLSVGAEGSASGNGAIAYNDSTGVFTYTPPVVPSVLTDLSISDGTNGQVLTTDGSGSFTFEDAGGGSQSRIIKTNTTSSLADGAEADLDITGFKAYTLMAITTDAAARVRLYVKAASRAADAARAEGVDPTSDAGLIAEVITTGAETVIISPGAYGFNLEPITTTNIACRVTNKSGSTDSVQVSLVILQLEA